MIKKLTLITILLLGNIAFSQEPKLTEKYLFATLKGKIDDKYDITMNIKISGVSYSWIGEISGQVSGNYHYDIFERGINFSGYIDENSMVIEAERDEVFTFELDEETLKKILEFKNITINGTWENKSKKFPCVINSIAPLGGKLSEIFRYSISNDEYDYGKDILYSPSMNVSYFGNDTEKIDIKNLKNIYERKLKKVVSNEIYTYSNCSSEITYFDNKILCIEEYIDWFGGGAHGDDWYNYTIISLETGKKLNNDFYKDLIDYNEEFEEFFKKEFIKYHEFSGDDFDDYYLPEPPYDFDFRNYYFPTIFIFNNDGTIDIYNDTLPKVIGVYRKTKIDMKKLKPYIKKDSFYRYLFD